MSHGTVHGDYTVPKDDPTPLVVVIPGLTSDSSSAVSDVMYCVIV